MKISLLPLALLCGLLALPSTNAKAWNSPGHMAVAGLAYDELTLAEQQRLVAILRQHPDVSRLNTDLGAPAPAGRDLVMSASTWPDLIRRDRSFTNNGYTEVGPITAVTWDHILHPGWHFIDMPVSLDGTPLIATPDANTVDAVTVTNVLVKQLNSREPDAAKAYDLGWLLHLVGDLHQPLHCVTGISKTLPEGDRGGNSVVIHGSTQDEHELHAFWDDVLGKGSKADPDTHALHLDQDVSTANGIIASLGTVALPAQANNVSPDTWVSEGVALARADVYNLPDLAPSTTGKHPGMVATLSPTYVANATADAKLRIKMAGHRLALILKPILDAPAPLVSVTNVAPLPGQATVPLH